MIKTGYKLYASFPKVAQGKTIFSVRDYDANDKEHKRYVTIMANNQVEVNDQDKVTISNIVGISTNEYNGKLGVTMYCDVEVLEKYKKKEIPVETESEKVLEKEEYNVSPVTDNSFADQFDTGPLLDLEDDGLNW